MGKLQFGTEDRKKVIVFSHERSGTHFLMNTLALNFGYISEPRVDLDRAQNINYYSTHGWSRMFRKLHDKPALNIFKSHHPVEFCAEIMPYLTEQFFVFYIHRDPRDVMVSFWEFIRKLSWSEGPVTSDVGQFMRAAPRGACLRYQMTQIPSMLHRWKQHVEGWLNCAETGYEGRIILVRYEDLNLQFEETLERLAEIMDSTPTSARRPDLTRSVVYPGKGKVGRYAEYFSKSDYAYIEATVGGLIRRLGIDAK